ncbi:unnamed protein product [Aphanomyces euteiches]
MGIEFEFEMDTDALSRAYFECAAEGNIETLRLLLSNDIHNELLNSVDVDGFSALMIAAAEGNRDIVLELLRRNADANLRTFELKSAALHFAAKNGDPLIVEEMCKHTKQIDFWNINADTPLVWACIEGRDEAVAILLEHGADPRVTNHYGATTLMCATMIGEETDEDSDGARRNIVNMLLAKSVSVSGLVSLIFSPLRCPELVNAQDRDGSTAMHLAASCGYLQCCQALLAGGADITLRNAVGQTPLEEAEQTGCDGSDVCVAFLKTRWAQLEDEVNARMRTMLEMEADSSSILTSSSSKASKKKKKQKKAAKKKKAAASTPVAASTPRVVPASTPRVVPDDEDSDISDDDDGSPGHAAAPEGVKAQPAPQHTEMQDEDASAWTTVGRKPDRKHENGAIKDIAAPSTTAPPAVNKVAAETEVQLPDSSLEPYKEQLQPQQPQLQQQQSATKNPPVLPPPSTVVAPPVMETIVTKAPENVSTATPLSIFIPPSPQPSTSSPPHSRVMSSAIPFLQHRPASRVVLNERRGNYRRPIKPTKLGWLDRLDENVREALAMLACGQCGDWINDNVQCPQCQQLYCARCVTSLCSRCGLHLSPLQLKHNVLAQQQAACMGLVKLSEEPKASLDSLTQQIYSQHPLAEEVALSPVGLIPGSDLTTYSMAQLDVLEELHHTALRQLNAARVAWARAQERVKFEQELKQHVYLQSFPSSLDTDEDAL